MSEKFRFSKEPLEDKKNGGLKRDKHGNVQYGMIRSGDHIGVNTDGNDVFRDVDYWSEESLKSKPLKELYPAPDKEEAGEYYELAYDDYRKQLAKIVMKLTGHDDEQIIDNVDEVVAEYDRAKAAGDEVRVKAGFSEPKYNEHAVTPFGKAIYDRIAGEAELRAQLEFRAPDELLMSDKGKYGLDKSNQIEKKSEWYNQNLEHIRAQLVEGRVSERDRRYVIKRNKDFMAKRTMKGHELDAKAEFYDKTLESLMYAVASRGVLGDAEPIWTSELDDIANGVDGAFSIACKRTDVTTKETSNVRLPIAIDCTAASSVRTVNRKLGQPENEWSPLPPHSLEYNGVAMPDIWTRLKYAVDSNGEDIDNHWAYRFVVGLDRGTMVDEILSDDKIEQPMPDIKKVINIQLRNQAYAKAVYCGLMAYNATSAEERANWLEHFANVMALRDAFGCNVKEAIAEGASSSEVIGDKHDAQQLIADKTNEIRTRLSEMIPRKDAA